MLIDDTAFDAPREPNLQLAGILRHELGHTWASATSTRAPKRGCASRTQTSSAADHYDRFSVMHYPQCNGGGDWALVLTGLDKAGPACMYGKGTNNPRTSPMHLPRTRRPATGTAGNLKVFDNQSVAKDAKKQYRPVRGEGRFAGAGEDDGGGRQSQAIPDLYVRFARLARHLTRWNCRPYTSGANETCELEVPANRNSFFVMVHGYANGSYNLEITYTKP